MIIFSFQPLVFRRQYHIKHLAFLSRCHVQRLVFLVIATEAFGSVVGEFRRHAKVGKMSILMGEDDKLLGESTSALLID